MPAGGRVRRDIVAELQDARERGVRILHLDRADHLSFSYVEEDE